MAEVAPLSEAPRRQIAIVNRYDGAADGRRMGSWQPTASGPNRALAGLQKLRNRSRDAIRNEWQSAASIRVAVTNLIGTGIVPRFTTTNEALKKSLTEKWQGFVEVADADGLLDFYGMQALGTRCWRESGEFFVRARPRRIGSSYGTAVQFQLLEPEMCPLLDADNWPGMPQNNRIRSGVEFNNMGQRVAFWFYKEHPGDNFSGSIRNDQLIRVTAEYVKQVFKPLRIGQIRGVPSNATNLAKLRVVTDFDDAVLARQHTANLFTGFLKKSTPTPDGIDPITGKAIEYDDYDAPMASLEAGTMQELAPGEDVVFADPPDAGTTYSEFMRYQTLGLSAGDGVPYELMTGDLKDVSDRTLRAILNDFQRMCEQDQWHVLIPLFCKWVMTQWVKYCVLSGDISMSEASEASKVQWSPCAFKYLHPLQDIQYRQAQVDAGFRSRASVIAEMGDDPVTVDAERKADQEREIKLGLSFEPVDPNNPPVDPAKQAEVDKQKAEAKKVKAEADLLAVKAKSASDVGKAESDRLAAEAERLRAEAALANAKVDLHKAEGVLLTARAAAEDAERDARVVERLAADARANAESEKRIAALEEGARIAREEADRKAQSHKDAEAFAAEQRRIVLAAERTRAEVVAIEMEAAKVGLEELRQ